MFVRKLFGSESESEAEQNSQEVPLLESCDDLEPLTPDAYEATADLDFSHTDYIPQNQQEYFRDIEQNEDSTVPEQNDSNSSPNLCELFFRYFDQPLYYTDF